jgi:protein-L-isoaspartate(D-aspartate) O-methyltransferase
MEDAILKDLREKMIAQQLIPRGISDKNVLEAFRKVPRHYFVPDELQDRSYDDYPLPIGSHQTISQPYMVALMTQSLGLKGGERVLEIGTGSGYQTAILAEIAKEVYSVERIAELSGHAKKILDNIGYKNITLEVGDGTLGWPEHAPYDSIIVTAGAPGVPESLAAQLKDGGRLVIPIGSGFTQVLTVVEKRGGQLKTEEACGCAFVPLIGKEGWAD